MYIRIVEELYSDGSIKYAVECRNYRGGFDTMSLPDGSGWAEFDTYKEAYKFAFPNKKCQKPYITSTKILLEDYSDLEEY